MIVLSLLLACGAAYGSPAPCSTPTYAHQPFCNKSLPMDERVKDAVGRMSLDEKINTLNSANTKGIPSLGLKLLEYGEALHGVLAGCAKTPAQGSTGCPTSFPAPIGLGAAFNRSLWRNIGQVIGHEARALHNVEHSTGLGSGRVGLMVWSPNVNLFRDPRWGRGQEVPGEDTFLTSQYVEEYVQGLQWGQGGEQYMQIGATCKHFFAYDLECSGNNSASDPWKCTRNGRDYVSRHEFDAQISIRDVVEFYLPVFETCVREAKAASIMCSYNSVNGVPSCANGDMQNTILREQWGFDGFVVSDCGAIGNVAHEHNYTKGDEVKAAAMSIKAGTDLDCGDVYTKRGAAALQSGELIESDLDTAIARQLKVFFMLGELEGPETVTYQNLGVGNIDTLEHRAIALAAAEESLVLLENDGVLPFPQTVRLAFLGPHANATQSMRSDYDGINLLVNSHSPLQAAQRSNLHVTYVPGHALDVTSNDTSHIPAAVAAARDADAAVLFVGLCADNCGTPVESEAIDRLNLLLPGAQQQLVESVLSLGKPTVVVLLNTGGPVDVALAKVKANAILHCFYPGQLGGDAIVNTLFGNNNPSGRLPYTMYPNAVTEQRPMTDMALRSVEGLTYKWYTGQLSGPPLWEFGHGLSYTNFTYRWSGGAESISLGTSRSLEYTVAVTNTGSRPGATTVLAFVEGDGVARPLRALLGFEKVHVAPRETKQVLITIPISSFAAVDDLGQRWVHPGSYSIFVGDVGQPVRRQVAFVGASLLLEDRSSNRARVFV